MQPGDPTPGPTQPPRGRTLVLFALALTWPMFLNGFPLLFSDSGVYLSAVTERLIPRDRPIYYSGFVVYSANLLGLYAVPFLQGLAVSYGSLVFVDWLAPRASSAWRLALFASLAVLTPLPWVVSWLMPDVFGGLVVLVPLLLVSAGGQLSGGTQLRLALLLLLALLCHSGNFLLCCVVSFVTVAVHLWRRQTPRWSGPLKLCAVVVLALGLAVLPNVLAFGRWTINPGSQAFLAARLVGDGLMQSFLARHCPGEPQLVLCDRQKELEGLTSNGFLWLQPSVADTTGAWKERAAEYQALNSRVLAESTGAVLLQGLRNTLSLLARSQPGDDPHNENFPAFGRLEYVVTTVENLYPGEFPRLLKARQQSGNLELAPFNLLHLGWTWLSYGLLGLAGLQAWRHRRDELVAAVALIAVALVANAAVHGVLSGVVTRYQTKVTWLATLAALTVLTALRRAPRPG